jgi:uncharacterized protein YkwD
MKNRGSWRGALVAAFAIGAGWIGTMGWPLSGLITLAAEQSNPPKEQSNPPKEHTVRGMPVSSLRRYPAQLLRIAKYTPEPVDESASNPPKEQSNSPKEQSNSPNPPPAPAAVQDANCPGKDNHALMCRLVNEYRAKHGLKPVQLDAAVTREAQYWSDQLNRQSACWFLYHDSNYHDRMRTRFPGRRFRENAACSGSTGGGAKFILQKWIDSSGHRENMLTPGWKTIGVGVTKNIWVIDFTN